MLKGLMSTAFLAAGARSENVRIFNAASMHHGFTFLRRARLLGRLVTLINEIDDVVDNMSAAERLKLGAAKYGNTACDFLKNDRLNPEPYFETIERLDDSGVITRNESVSFSNIYAVLLARSAEVEARLVDGNDFEGREQLTELNMQIVKTLGAHILQHVMPSKLIKEKADDSSLSEDDALEPFPEAMRFGYLIEMCDDLEDFLVDIRREASTGILTPNWIATNLAQGGVLYDSDASVSRDIRLALEKHASSERRVSLCSLPRDVQQAIRSGQDRFLDLAEDLPNMQAGLIKNWWSTLLTNGIKSPAIEA